MGLFMFDKIKDIILVLSSLRSFIFMLLSSPKQMIDYAKLGYDIKSYYDKKDVVDASFLAIDKILEFRKTNKNDFEDIFNHLEKLSSEYKANRQIHDSLLKAINDKKD